MTAPSRRLVPTPGTVLIVDRDASARRTIRGILETWNYRVIDAADPGRAERIASVFVGPIHAMILDVDFQDASPGALVDHIRSIHPEIGVLFTSARPITEIVSERIIGADDHFIRKPFGNDELIAKIRALHVAGP